MLRGSKFTYDFGINVAQSTIVRLTRLTGASIALASAYYALKQSSEMYVNTLRENTLRMGGVLSTMQAMQEAQDRLIRGATSFKVDDQLRGMNALMSVGIDVKPNMEWVSKAAHATGRSYADFSRMIASAIQGNSYALVEAGLMTARATRMFDKYQGNTVMRQTAIMNFLKNHRGLQNAIKQDFETIQDQIHRISETWRAFLQAVMGQPNDPDSLYGKITSTLKMIAESLSKTVDKLRAAGYMIGQVLGWIVRQVGHFLVWTGKQVNKLFDLIGISLDNHQEKTKSMIVWLEFWKVRLLKLFREYETEIKVVTGLLLGYRALKNAFVISSAAVASVQAYSGALASAFILRGRYASFMGKGKGIGTPFLVFIQSLAAFLPRRMRRVWVAVGKGFQEVFSPKGGLLSKAFHGIVGFFRGVFVGIFRGVFNIIKGIVTVKPMLAFLGNGFKFLIGVVRNIPMFFNLALNAGKALYAFLLGSNPMGWIILAVSLFVVLYNKSSSYRKFMNSMFKFFWEKIKFIYNIVVGIFTYAVIGAKYAWNWIKDKLFDPIANGLKKLGLGIGKLWDKFKDSSVGKFLDKIQKVVTSVTNFIGLGNQKLSENINAAAQRHGLPALAVTGRTDYQEDDDTNYLAQFKDSIFGSSNGTPTGAPSDMPVTGNPLVNPSPDAFADMGFSGGQKIELNNGAIQIVVHKGEHIDENLLAKKVKQIILDISRENNMRGGTV